ncbi:MAG TPA: ABC transporter permease, partial [Rhodothermales bacterium]|nr:ABC transporter permease [Rhodothermales bacterium]
MLRNYLKIAARNLRNHKAYTLINVSGLAVGMACCLLIFMLVRHEWSFDRFHANADRIYRTTIPYTAPDGTQQYQNMMFPDFTPLLAEAFPSIEHATRFVRGSQDIEVGNEIFQQAMVEVDAPFFEMFSFPMLAGDPATALVDPSGMVITDEVAQAFFGVTDGSYADALGQSVSITRNEVVHDFTITGVVETPPENSSLQFEVAASFENYEELRLGGNNWGGRTSTYVLFNPGEDKAAFEEALQPFVDTQFADYQEALRANEFLAEGDGAFGMVLQPLPRMHLEPDVWMPYEASAHDPLYSYILLGIGLLVLLIACINFMTLSVGRSASRAREVGMRKVLGAQRPQLMKQFWGEALMLTAVSLILGVLLALLALPFFNNLTGKALSLVTFHGYELVLATLGLLFVVGFVAGGYPAALLSRFQPAEVLKGNLQAGGKNRLTRSLVVLQYTISIALIVGTIVMSQQLHYMLNKDLGYEDDLVLVVNTNQVGRADAPLVLDR